MGMPACARSIRLPGPGAARNRFAVDFDPADVGVAALAMPASWSQINKTDLIDFAQIDLVQQRPFRLNFFDIQLEPSKIAEIELAFAKIEGIGIRVISDKPRPVRQFHDRTYLMEA